MSMSITGSRTATPSASTEALPFFWVPTKTLAPAAATSEAVPMAGLLFFLVRNKDWLKDPKLQDQYVKSVERTQSENEALLKDLPTPPKVPAECGQDKKRKRSSLNPIMHTLDTVEKVLACTEWQLNLLHGLIVPPSGAIDLPLVDTIVGDLKSLANKLQDDGKDRNRQSTSRLASDLASSITKHSSSSSASLSSSSSSYSTISIIADDPPENMPDEVNEYMAWIVEAKIASENLLSGLSLSMGTMTGSATAIKTAGVSPVQGIGGTGTASRNGGPISTSTVASTDNAATQASLASQASASSASEASATSQYLATVFDPSHTMTSCGEHYGNDNYDATAVPRPETSCVALAIEDFCTPPEGPLVLKAGEPAYQNFGLPRPNEKIVFQLAFEWDPRPECHTKGSPAPRAVATPAPHGKLNPDKTCNDAFHALLDGCDAANGQDKHGGRLYTGCGIVRHFPFLFLQCKTDSSEVRMGSLHTSRRLWTRASLDGG